MTSKGTKGGPGRSKPKTEVPCDLPCHSVIFTDTTSHTLKRFSLEASVLDGKKEVEKVDTIIGDGTSGAEDGFIDVARVSHPTGIISERGVIFFVDTGSKSVRLISKISALIKYIRVMEDIYRAFILTFYFVPSCHLS